MQVAGVIVAWLRTPGLDCLRQLFPVRTEVAGKRFEESESSGVVELAELEFEDVVDPTWAQPPSPIPWMYAFQLRPSATNCCGNDSVICG